MESNGKYVIAQIRELPKRAQGAVTRALKRGCELIISRSKRDFLSGPRPGVLGIVSGRLRGSLTKTVTSDAKGIIGTIGTNVPYARRHELGFQGVENVRAHTRVTGASPMGKKMSTAAFLRMRGPVRDENKVLIGYRRSGKGAVRDLASGSVGVAFVKAHQRRVNYPGKPFLRPAIEAEIASIQRDVGNALAEIAKGGHPPTV